MIFKIQGRIQCDVCKKEEVAELEFKYCEDVVTLQNTTPSYFIDHYRGVRFLCEACHEADAY